MSYSLVASSSSGNEGVEGGKGYKYAAALVDMLMKLKKVSWGVFH